MDQVVATCRGWRDLVNTSLQGLEPVQVIYKLVVFPLNCEYPLSMKVLGASVVSTLALAQLWALYTDCGDTGPVAAVRKKVFKLLR